MLLVENNIYQSDMYPANIFIHWLNDNSFYGDKNIKNLEYITYKISSKYYKIKTYGFIMILGDTGTFNIKIKKDVILIGQAPDIVRDYYKYRVCCRRCARCSQPCRVDHHCHYKWHDAG